MKKSTYILIIFLSFSLCGWGQNAATQPSGLDLRFIDENTGYAVFPEKVEVKNRENAALSRVISKEQISKNGTVSIQLANGVYDIKVYAKEYIPMSIHFELLNKTLDVCFNLDPVTPRKEMTPSYIQSLHQSNAMLIVGFIVDDFTGQPLENVMIYSSDEIVRAYSGKNGFFQLAIPLPENENEAKKRGTIFFKTDDYVIEVRENFDMWPNGDTILRIRMKKGSGINRENVIENRDAIRTLRN